MQTGSPPYGKDIFRELADECHREDIKIGCQFSIGRNWTNPRIADKAWIRTEEGRKYWDEYFQREVKGQIRELLTNYGDIGLMWFDSPVAALSEEIVTFVHKLQPGCLVNGRVGSAGEYGSTFDSTIKSVPSPDFWECCSTIGESWAYRRKENMRYSSSRALTQYLVDIAGKNGMNLLNIGPLPDGSINPEEVSRLTGQGKWMLENKQFFVCSAPNPFQISYDFGTILVAENKLFLHFFGWPEEKFVLYGLKNRVKRAHISNSGESVQFTQDIVPGTALNRLLLELPFAAPDDIISLVVLEIQGQLDVATGIVPQADGSIVLDPAVAEITPQERNGATVESRSDGRLIRWKEKAQTLIWDEVYFPEGGSFQANFVSSPDTYRREGNLPDKAEFTLILRKKGGTAIEFPLSFNRDLSQGTYPVGNKGHIPLEEHLRPEMHTAGYFPSGAIEVPLPGLYRIRLALDKDLPSPMRFRQLRLYKNK